jgi:hypothetical protein
MGQQDISNGAMDVIKTAAILIIGYIIIRGLLQAAAATA